MRLQTVVISLAISVIHCVPQPLSVTQLPGYTQLTAEQVRHLQHKGFGETIKTFIPTAAYRELDDDYEADSNAESSQDRAPTYQNTYQNYPIPVQSKSSLQPLQNYPLPVRTTQSKTYSSPTPKPDRRPLSPQQYIRKGDNIQDANQLEAEEEEKEEEPDKLSLLLPQSKFNCNGKHTGYYADEDLKCEVFHYCQENAKHSWICPEGFRFHQVHLICMPPGGDNICDKSSDYHFVNDFLYRPVNLEEYQKKPNVTLKYSDRYYPEQYQARFDDYDEERAPIQHQHSVRVPVQQRLQSPATIRPVSAPQTVPQRLYSPSTIRPQASIGQVFRSPEEVNIPLQQRRPVQYTTEAYDDDY
ncbi:hypothetical protein NQ315_006737 [Exocentrus adspersus]|uniref:Chitin-binding type-2 domain-containing protein n=1 Tax=Exocentrus adspersus TaxID=1586481 RepID=A0AAV8WCI4_9CUCU|nr:hypothetical protein NQ315_006737 [Exocentrus adspersus]